MNIFVVIEEWDEEASYSTLFSNKQKAYEYIMNLIQDELTNRKIKENEKNLLQSYIEDYKQEGKMESLTFLVDNWNEISSEKDWNIYFNVETAILDEKVTNNE